MNKLFDDIPLVNQYHRVDCNHETGGSAFRQFLTTLTTFLALLMLCLPLSAAGEIGTIMPKAKHIREIDSERGRYVQVSPMRWHKLDTNEKVLEVLEEMQRTRFMTDSAAPDYIYLRTEVSGDRIIFDLQTNTFKWMAFSDPENSKMGKINATKNGLEPQVVQTFSNVDEVTSFQAGRYFYQYLGDNRWSATPLDGVGAAIIHRVASQHGSVIELYHYDDKAQATYNTTIDLKERRVWVAPASEAAKEKLKNLETGKFEITNLGIRHGQMAGSVVTMSVQQALQKSVAVMLKFSSKYMYHEPGATSFSLRKFDQANAANYRFRFVPVALDGTLVANDKVIADAPQSFVHIKSNSGAYLSVKPSSTDEVTIKFADSPKTLQRNETFKMTMDRDRSTIGLPGSRAVLIDDGQHSDVGKGFSILPTQPLVSNASFIIERPPTSQISVQIKADPQGSAINLMNKIQLELVLESGSRLTPKSGVSWNKQPQATTQDGFEQFALEMPELDNVAFGDVVRIALTNLNPSDNIVVRSMVTRDYESFFCNCLVHPKTATASNTRVITTDASKSTFASAAFWLDGDGLQVSPELLRSNADVTEFIALQKKSAMRNTPTQRNIGKFLFDRLAVTVPERAILDSFINAYDGDFISDYLSIGDQGPGYDNFKSAINTALGKLGAGGDMAALNDMKSELATLINNRQVAKKVVAANRDFLKAKYALAQSEVDVFREYANIQASETEPAQADSKKGAIAMTVMLTIANIAELNPQWGDASALGRAAVSLIEAIGNVADAARDDTVVSDNNAKDLNGIRNDIIQATNLLKLELEVKKRN